jgi:hypothetical protein
MALPDRCHPWHPRHQCGAVHGTVLGLSLLPRLTGTSVAQALLGFRRRGDLHLPAASIRRRLKLAASYRTANCSRGPKAPGTFRRDGDARMDRKVVCRGGGQGEAYWPAPKACLETTQLTQVAATKCISCSFRLVPFAMSHSRSLNVTKLSAQLAPRPLCSSPVAMDCRWSSRNNRSASRYGYALTCAADRLWRLKTNNSEPLRTEGLLEIWPGRHDVLSCPRERAGRVEHN